MGLEALFGLHGKLALVTGANGGLGRAIAAALGDAGARLILVDRDAETVQAAVSAQAGRNVENHAVDLADPDQTMAFAEQLLASGTLPDICVFNAGIQGPAGSLAQMRANERDRVMTVNLYSVADMLAVLLPAMGKRGSGRIILMSSIAGLRGNGKIGLYGLSKAALSQLARNLAVEWGPHGITVNAIAPGLIRTPLAEALLDDERFMARRLAMTPLRRVGEPFEIAGIVTVLAAAAGGFVTGQTIVVDGGTLISDGS